LFLLFQTSNIWGQNIQFENYFKNKTFRIDLCRTGDATTDITSIQFIYRYGVWSGNPQHLIDPFPMGRNRIKVYDLTQNKLIYSRGYDSYYGEYRTSQPALDGVKRTFLESVFIPEPIRPVMLVLEERDKQYVYHVKQQFKIDPNDYHILSESPAEKAKVINVIKNGSSQHKVDLVIVGEGYSKKDSEKFSSDLNKFVKIFFEMEPYKSNKEKFNIYGLYPESEESGIDQPTKHIYVNTALNCTFNSMDSPRYLLTEDTRKLYNICANVPFDAIIIMCNVNRYGGGGIYNFYATFTASEYSEDYVFLHEFGHSFAGLADEYYSSSVAYNEFYPKGIEPAEPNITALLDPDNLKWKESVSENIQIPTEWGKEKFDSLEQAVGKLRNEKYQKLKSVSSETERKKINAEYNALIAKVAKEADDFLTNHPLKDKVGAFEGAGYASKGLYRPTLNSIMKKFTKKDKSYKAVSEKAIIRMINYYAK